MSDDTPQNTNDADASKQDRLNRIVASKPQSTAINTGYSKFIRSVQIVLPLIAVILVVIIFGWDKFQTENVIVPQTPAEEQSASIGKNELLNPKFESVDEKGQPYSVTAKRAIQGESNEDVVILEEPSGEMLLASGEKVTIQSIDGAYRQNTRRLLLQGNVVLTHDLGYAMRMEELHVDMKASTAWSDVDVNGDGPEGTITAKGLKASSPEETLIFTGPAKLVLTLENDAMGFKGLTP